MRICWSDFTVLVWAPAVVTAERRARRPKSVWRKVIDSFLLGCLFELGDDGARLPFHELFGVDSVPGIEPNQPPRQIVHDALTIGRRRFQRAIFEVHDDDV